MRFIEAYALSRIAAGKAPALRADDRDITPCKVEDEVFAIENSYPHQLKVATFPVRFTTDQGLIGFAD